jgi:hypothetical protein
MALSLHKEPLTSKGIMKWITSTFDFYRNMALEALWAQHTGDADDNEGILQDYFNAMNHLDLPVTTSGDHEDANGAFYQMSAAAIRWVLSDEIGEKRKGTFPFLRLPAELRTCVCDMVFSYPRSGLNPQRGRSSTGRRSTYFVAVTRDVTQKFTFGLWDDNDPELQVSPPSQILALLRVNNKYSRKHQLASTGSTSSTAGTARPHWTPSSLWCPRVVSISGISHSSTILVTQRLGMSFLNCWRRCQICENWIFSWTNGDGSDREYLGSGDCISQLLPFQDLTLLPKLAVISTLSLRAIVQQS